MARSRLNLKWNFPIAQAVIKKIKKIYKKHGLLKTIGYVIVIVIGLKVVVINASIFLINSIFGLKIPYGPILQIIL